MSRLTMFSLKLQIALHKIEYCILEIIRKPIHAIVVATDKYNDANHTTFDE